MGNIYEKIKAASALKANAALIQGAADSAKKFQSYSTDQDAPSQSPPPAPVETPEEKKDDTNVDDVVNTEEPKVEKPSPILSALKLTGSPLKNKDEVKKSMGKGFVNDEFGDVEETTTTTKGKVGEFDNTWDKEAAGGLDYADWIKIEGNKAKEDKFIDSITTPGETNKTYAVTPTESKVEETTPGTESNYNMSYKNALSARMSEGVQRRDSIQNARQFNKDVRGFDKGGLFRKKGSKQINPATGKVFADATEYADFRAGNSGKRNKETGLLDTDAKYQQKLNSRRGEDKDAVTISKKQKDQYDETKHGKREDITYVDSKTPTNSAEVVEDDKKTKKPAPTAFRLKKKSGAMKNFKYKK